MHTHRWQQMYVGIINEVKQRIHTKGLATACNLPYKNEWFMLMMNIRDRIGALLIRMHMILWGRNKMSKWLNMCAFFIGRCNVHYFRLKYQIPSNQPTNEEYNSRRTRRKMKNTKQQQRQKRRIRMPMKRMRSLQNNCNCMYYRMHFILGCDA